MYVYDLTDLSAAPRKLAPDALDEQDAFGSSVAVAGETLVAGALGDDNQGKGIASGAAYVYNLTDLDATPTKLVPDELERDDRFGESVAVAGNTLAVGAPGDDNQGVGAGAVYVFR